MTQTSLFLAAHARARGIELIETPLEETAIVKNAKSEEVKRKRIECLRFINNAFPIFLPLKQHEMIPSQLEYKDREYWGNAIHFLLSNKAHGFPMWKQFQEQVRSMDATFTCRPHISAEKKNLILKHLQGSSASEKDSPIKDFLLNKMILVQLPFQPVLLFQWLSIAMTLLIGCDFNQLTNMSIPEKFKHRVVRLQNGLKETQVNIGFLFDYLQHQVESENEIFVGNLELFERVLKKVIDGISIFHTPQASIFFEYLAENSITESWPDEPLYQVKKTAMPLKERNYIFNLDFWKALPSKDLKMFGSSEEKFVRKARTNQKKLTPVQLSSILKTIFKAEHVNSFNLNQIMLDHGFLQKVIELDHKASDFKSLLFKLGDQGSVGDILFANAYSEFQNAKFEIACRIAKNSKIPLRLLLEFESSSCDASDIEDVISTNSEIEKEPFSLQTMISILMSDIVQCNTSDFLDQQQIVNVVNIFEKKIQLLVPICILSNLEMNYFEKEKDEELRDWQVAQILLPCFVASYNNLCKANPPIDEDMKFWYADFIHNLIIAYQGNDGIRKSSWKNIKKDIDENSVLKDDAKLLAFFENVIESFNNKIKQFPNQIGAFVKFCPVWDSLYEVLRTKHGGSSQNEGISSEPSVYWNWLMWDFFSKMKHAISISG